MMININRLKAIYEELKNIDFIPLSLHECKCNYCGKIFRSQFFKLIYRHYLKHEYKRHEGIN